MRIPGLTAALFLVLAAQAAPRQSFEARVIGVSDGDTITVQVSNTPPYRIRLAGIDAPEKGQAFSDRSKQNLSRLVYRQTVRIEWSKPDKYSRVVGTVFVANVDVNLAQVADGFAWHFKQYEREQSKRERQAYSAAEKHARDQRLGLWKDPNPVSPWDWRRRRTPPP